MCLRLALEAPPHAESENVSCWRCSAKRFHGEVHARCRSWQRAGRGGDERRVEARGKKKSTELAHQASFKDTYSWTCVVYFSSEHSNRLYVVSMLLTAWRPRCGQAPAASDVVHTTACSSAAMATILSQIQMSLMYFLLFLFFFNLIVFPVNTCSSTPAFNYLH